MKTRISLSEMADHETILIYSKPKNGKTWSVVSIAESVLRADENNNVFYISTDNGLKRTAQEYFGEEFEWFANRITHYYLHDLERISDIVKEIKSKVKPNDLIIIDLFSHIWEMCQQKFIETASGGNIVGYLEQASRDAKKFGAFDSNKWMYIKKIDSIFINELIIFPPCKVVGVCAEKSVEFDKMYNNKNVTNRYGIIGSKPAGQPELSYHFNTIVFIGEEENRKFFCVLGDRGSSKNIFEKHYYGKNFWEVFLKYRSK